MQLQVLSQENFRYMILGMRQFLGIRIPENNSRTNTLQPINILTSQEFSHSWQQRAFARDRNHERAEKRVEKCRKYDIRSL